MVRTLLTTTNTMTIFELLAREHTEVDADFHAIQCALERRDVSAARTRFDALSTRLLAAMRAEHAVVYPSFAYHAGLGDEVKRAIREHHQIEQAINRLRLVPLAPEAWQGALARMHVLVADHVDTEEWILFPVARLRLTSEQSASLATEYSAAQDHAMPTTACSITYDAA